MGTVGEVSTVCSQIVLKCLYLARIGRLDILWSVNKLTRAITKWTSACDKRLTRLISDTQHTSECEQFCYVGNTSQQCRLGLFAGDLENSKSTSGRNLVHFRSSHARANNLDVKEKRLQFHTALRKLVIISLDAGLRMDRIPALDLSHLVKEVFHSSQNQLNNTTDLDVQGNSSRNATSDKHSQNQTKVPTQHDNFNLYNVDHVLPDAKNSRFGAVLYVFEDNEAVIKMIIKGRSPTMRRVSRTHRVALD